MKRDEFLRRDAWRLFFVLGIILLNYPFVTIFNKPVELFGLPLFFLYLTLGWPASILVIYLFVRRSRRHRSGRNNP